jgi:hypothetical protein
MRIEREMQDGNGRRFTAIVEIDEAGPKLEAAIARLANKARAGGREVTALAGAVRVTVTELG